MKKTLAETVYDKHKNIIIGVRFSKHFFERFFERFPMDLDLLGLVIKKIDSDLCEILFDLSLECQRTSMIIRVGGVRIAVSKIPETKIPTVLVRTIY